MQLFKKPKVAKQAGPVIRDDVIGDIARQDALMRRRGGAADIVAGMAGEGPIGGKVTLGS